MSSKVTTHMHMDNNFQVNTNVTFMLEGRMVNGRVKMLTGGEGGQQQAVVEATDGKEYHVPVHILSRRPQGTT